ncbi:Ribosomal RNA large subunit methyltransferase L [Sterolibacterium denitrificans]|uniref:Ribosomal RNA large subunit methyltransferase L n=1 Tax=Sterolibacterium denitrificans TaxID=157592 RepID=A0A7Z7HP31_9PROT|nr:THUMP domain-containing protein [Sterolibacterium denitrificans]SMB21116.1 Ribosomal RNA large subunit methyltransferase L [Sterolibacterium denitrificans]
MNKLENFFAPCPRGLEALLADDVRAAGALGASVKIVPGGVQFACDWRACYALNLESRIASRVLWRVAEGAYQKEEDVYRLAMNVDWPALFKVEQTLRVYVTAIRSPLKSLEFITLRVKDAVCDRFRAACGERPSVNTARPDVRIHLFLTADRATLYVDTSGEPLWQRGHKIAKIEAPVKENLAAGILRLIGWQPGIPLYDPMCGSGTFLLEAAQMSLNDAPGLSRDAGEFGFEKLKNFKAAVWRELRQTAAARRDLAPASLAIHGADISRDAVARARQNLDYAGIGELVDVRQGDILQLPPPAGTPGILIANPPYGERLGEIESLAAFYPQLGDALKQHYAGWNCWFFSADSALPKRIGLAVKRKIPLYNGPLECRLYHYPMVAGGNRKAK